MTAATPRRSIAWLPFLGIFGGLFCGYTGLMSALPVLPGFVRDRFDANDLLVGVVVTSTALTALLVRPVAGMLADRHGYRLVMRVGGLLVAAGGALYFVAPGLPGLVLVRLLLGVGEASLFVAGAGWIVSLSPRERRGQVIGLYGVSMWGGIAAGTALGAVLQQVGYGAVWTFATVVPLVGVLLVSLVPAPENARQPGARINLLPSAAFGPGIGLACASLGYAGLAAFVVLHLQARGIGAGVVVLSVYGAVYAGTRLVIGHFPDKYGPRRVATWCAVGEAAGLLVIAAAPNLPVAVAGGVLMGVGFSLLHPSLALMVMNRTDPTQQGAAIGAYTSFWDLGLFVGGPVTGAVATGLGYPSVFVLGAVGALAAMGVALVLSRPSHVPHEPAAADG